MSGPVSRQLAVTALLSLLVVFAAAPIQFGASRAEAGEGDATSDLMIAGATAEATADLESADNADLNDPEATDPSLASDDAPMEATVELDDATVEVVDESLVIAAADVALISTMEPFVMDEPVAEPIPLDGEVEALIASGAIPALTGSDQRVLVDQIGIFFPEEMEGVEVVMGGGAARNPFLQVRAQLPRMTCFDLVAFVVDGSRSISTVIHNGPLYRGGPTVYRVTTTGVAVSGFVISFGQSVTVRPLAGTATYGFWNHTRKPVAPQTLLISVNGGRAGPRFVLSFPSTFTLLTLPGGGLNPLSFSAPGSLLFPAQTFSNATNQGFYLFRDGATQVNGVIVAKIERPC